MYPLKLNVYCLRSRATLMNQYRTRTPETAVQLRTTSQVKSPTTHFTSHNWTLFRQVQPAIALRDCVLKVIAVLDSWQNWHDVGVVGAGDNSV